MSDRDIALYREKLNTLDIDTDDKMMLIISSFNEITILDI